MNDKNILLALRSHSNGEGMLRFLKGYLSGRNLRLTLCILHESNKDTEGNEELITQFSMLCQQRDIPLVIRNCDLDTQQKLTQQTAYADLLIMEKNTLIPLALRDELGVHSCSIIVVPPYFRNISNILIVHDGSQASLKSIKEFCQVFSEQLGDTVLTLLVVTPEEREDIDRTDELMLVDYLKHYSRNVGVLKVRAPLTEKLLRPVPYNNTTLVVATLSFMLSNYGEHSIFKPFFDDKSTLFLPAEN